MDESFGVEHGEAFLSIVGVLAAEAEGSGPQVGSEASGELDRLLNGGLSPQAPAEPVVVAHPRWSEPAPLHTEPLRPEPVGPVAAPTYSPVQLRPAASVPSAAPVRPAAAPVRPAAAASTTHPSPAVGPLTDELTGVGGPLALRRDLMLESALPSIGGPRYALISIDVQPVAEVRRRAGVAVADRLMKTLVEAIRSSLRPSDSIYRSGPEELTLLLRGNAGGGEQARFELEGALRQALAERGLPSVRLAPATAGRLRSVTPEPVGHTPQAAAV